MKASLRGWFFFLLNIGAIAATPTRNPLPAAREGKCPIQQPKYEGVEQLLLLSSRWVVVVTTDVADMVKKLDEITNGEYFKMQDRWEASEKAGKPDWGAYKGLPKLREQHMAAAREAIGERKLDTPEFYTIRCGNDVAKPVRVTRVLVSLSGRQVRGGPNIHYAHYSYLELPQPMQTGKTYTIALGNGKKVTFLFDEMQSVSRAIKVNQVGYVPGASQKFAYLGAFLYEFGPLDFSAAKQFHVVNAANGQVVYTGNVKLREKNPRFSVPAGKDTDPAKRPVICGEDVYEMDLGPLKDEGEFFISVPGVGRSWTFRHARDVYGEAFYIACRGLFHQRCGIALEEPFTAWTRPRCHPQPVGESKDVPFDSGSFKPPKGYERFDVIGATLDMSHATTNVVGGWHDAADWDRNIMHYLDVFDLLTAFELAPKKFTDGQLNIPESGNGIPDILDEAEFGLRVWKRSMTDRGGVAGTAETSTHPTIDADFNYAFSRRTRWSSLVFAAAAAQYAQLVKPFNAAQSDEYAAAAKKAFSFGTDPHNSLGKVAVHAAKNRGKGEKYTFNWEEKDAALVPYLLHAKLRLFLLTNDKSYIGDVAELSKKMPLLFEWPLTDRDNSVWSVFALARGGDAQLPAALAETWRNVYVAAAEKLCTNSAAQPYRQSWPREKDMHAGWGASVMTNPARQLLAAFALTGQTRYRDIALHNADFMLGVNPMGLSWTTGLGFVYPVHFQHAISEDDGILDPVPGLTPYGITGGPIYFDFRSTVWQSGKTEFINPLNKNVPFFRRWMAHPMANTAQCEFTIHETVAATVFTYAMLMDEGWTPSAELKNRHPRRDDLLFGYWYLP